jgi:predicted RNase H-like HicB family nuclease
MSSVSAPQISVRALVRSEPSGGYWAEVPEFPGCYTQGESLDELLDN